MSRVVCAWCGAVLREGPEPTSHGACGPCAAALVGETLSSTELRARLAELAETVDQLAGAVETAPDAPGLLEVLAEHLDETAGLHRELRRRARDAVERTAVDILDRS